MFTDLGGGRWDKDCTQSLRLSLPLSRPASGFQGPNSVQITTSVLYLKSRELKYSDSATAGRKLYRWPSSGREQRKCSDWSGPIRLQDAFLIITSFLCWLDFLLVSPVDFLGINYLFFQIKYIYWWERVQSHWIVSALSFFCFFRWRPLFFFKGEID